MLRFDWLLVTLCGALVLSPEAIAAQDEVPDGLESADWSGIRTAYEAHRHAAFAVEGGYQARNPGQGWCTGFDGRGFTVKPDAGGWKWGLQLERYGFSGDERAISEPRRVSAEGQRVAYDWDGVLEEWFVNDTRGLEHGFTVRERPPESARSERGPLTLILAVRGELHAEPTADGRSVRFTDDLGAAVLTYAGLTVLDADGRALVGGFERIEEGVLLSIDERGARYPLTIDPLAQQAYLKASNTGAGDRFGFSVSVSESGDTVVVGAEWEDSSATGVDGDPTNNDALDSGAAYVFVRNGATWSQQAYLKASNTGAEDAFGYSVSVSGDTAVVSALVEDSSATGVNGDEDDNSANGAGAAYVFVRNGTTWSQQAYLKASNTDVFDSFGHAVSAFGDTVVVAALQEDSNATGVDGDQTNNSASRAGAAYVFERSGTSWSQEAYLKASNTGADDEFGYSVSVSGDTVVVGARWEDSNATGVNGDQSNNSASSSGAAYVFVRSGMSWSQQAYLKASNTGAEDEFGGSVAVSEDTLVIGARFESSNATGVNGDQSNNSALASGAAYVFVRSGTTWSQSAYVKASNTEGGSMIIPGDGFGSAVAISGDRFVIGAPREDSNATGVNGDQSNNSAFESGAAYVFVRNGTTWSQEAYLKASNTGTTVDEFGWSVGVSDHTVVIGAPFEDSDATGVNGNQGNNSATDAGATYVFSCAQANVSSRNAGTNPASYVASPMVIGGTFTATVDNNLASQSTSILFAFDTPLTLTLGGGQRLLCLDAGGSGELFTGAGLSPSSSAGGVDSFSLALADEPATCGLLFYSQAIQFGNPPFVLSNAQDLTIGSL